MIYGSRMKCFFLWSLLIITYQQSCCNEEKIPPADEINDLVPVQKSDLKSYYVKNREINHEAENDLDCHQRKEKTIPLKFHEDIELAKTTLKTEIPVEYIIVRGSTKKCVNEKECEMIVQLIRKEAKRKGCDPIDNFFVGGDGNVYEGRGWDKAPYWNLNGLQRKAITVQFFGDFMNEEPPPQVMEAFQSSLQIGVWLGKISKNYKVTSMRQIFKDNAYLGAKLDKYLMTWGNWMNATFNSSIWEYTIPKRLNFVFRSQWKALEPLKELAKITRPVAHVMISDGSERCPNRSECSLRLKAEQDEERTHYGDLLHNFYIGEEGEVYEGRGWDVAPQWYLPDVKDGFLSVKFIGSFESKLPSDLAIGSFKQLIHIGVWLGKIQHSYRLFSLRQVYRDRNLTGESLHKLAEGWAPWWDQGQTKNAHEWQYSPFVRSLDWGADFSAWGSAKISVAADYVIAYDGAERCFAHPECKVLIREEQKENRNKYGNLLDNFYIGEDGGIYEGRGWNNLPEWHSLFPGIAFITVKFMGSFEKDVPNWIAMTAFNTLLKAGINSRKISPDYKLITLRQTCSVAPYTFYGLESRLKEMNSWSNTLTRVNNHSIPLYVNLIFPRNRWSTLPNSQHPKLKHPIQYVVVGGVERPCSSRDACIHTMKKIYDYDISKGFTNIVGNFYIGGDGWAYEGRGWEETSPLNMKESDQNFLFVIFLGNFTSTPASPFAWYGFNHLLKSGMSSRKISRDYKIISINQMFPGKSNSDSMLLKEIKLWNRWSERVPYFSGMNDSLSAPAVYVPRLSWNPAANWTSIARFDERIRRVLILNVGNRCFTGKECIAAIRDEQNKSDVHQGVIMDNFYVGEDGRAYEGRGWDCHPSRSWEGQPRDLITVAFLGNFENDLPSPKAQFAFHYLMRLGMYLERMGDSYRLESSKNSCHAGMSLGKALDEDLKSWDMWSPSSLKNC